MKVARKRDRSCRHIKDMDLYRHRHGDITRRILNTQIVHTVEPIVDSLALQTSSCLVRLELVYGRNYHTVVCLNTLFITPLGRE